MLVVVFYFCVVVILYTLSRFKLDMHWHRGYRFCYFYVCNTFTWITFFKCIALKQKFLLKNFIIVPLHSNTPCLLLKSVSFTICEINICLHRRWDIFQVIVVFYSSIMNIFQEGIICLKLIKYLFFHQCPMECIIKVIFELLSYI